MQVKKKCDTHYEYLPSGIRPTLNQMGFVFDHTTEYGNSFLEACRQHCGTALELGSGFNSLASRLLNTGTTLYVNDLSEEHLRILSDTIDASKRDQLRFVPGKFPDDLDFKDNFFDSIYCCNMFHFLNCEELVQGIDNLYSWIKPGGQVFLVTGSSFVSMLNTFMPTYYQRKKEKERFPGFIEDMSICNHNWVPNLPQAMHFMEKELLESCFTDAGFEVEKSSYINRFDFPDHMRMDGRENVGIIACKK